MPHTPGAADLPGAVDEADLLSDLVGGQLRVLHGELLPREFARLYSGRASHHGLAIHANVCGALRGSPWVHFACHAASDTRDPSASHLMLMDHVQKPLTVLDLSRLRLDGQLAFLAACGTARGAPRLADEAIQLASAFQIAGYRHVIATLWPIGDRRAVRMTKEIYMGLGCGANNAALVVHEAVRRRRNLLTNRPSSWAAYIHSGA